MTDQTTTIQHPSWCDQSRCQAGQEWVGDREHLAAEGADVELSLHDRQGDYVQHVATFIRQRPTEAGPTIGLYSESVGIDSRPGDGFELSMTRAEAIRLWSELGRMIDATA